MADSSEKWYNWQIFVDKSGGQEWDRFIRALYWNKKFLLKIAWEDTRYNDIKVTNEQIVLIQSEPGQASPDYHTLESWSFWGGENQLSGRFYFDDLK